MKRLCVTNRYLRLNNIKNVIKLKPNDKIDKIYSIDETQFSNSSLSQAYLGVPRANAL